MRLPDGRGARVPMGRHPCHDPSHATGGVEGAMNTVEAVQSAIEAFNAGDRTAIMRAMGRAYFDYVPPADAPGASEVIGGLIGDLETGLPDLTIALDGDPAPDGDRARFRATIRGTHTGVFWGVPPTGATVEWPIDVRVRPVDGGLAFNLEDVSLPVIMGLLRSVELVNPADQMHLPPRHPSSLPPEIILRLAFNGQMADKPCSHLGEVHVTRSEAVTCSSCGPDEIWPALRVCLTCGHVGCCDTSNNKHARAHFEETGHPLMRSIRAGETWGWCYADGILVGGDTIDRLAPAPTA